MLLERDTGNAALLGVCAGIARAADVDPVLVRIAAVLISIFLAPIAIPAYLYAGLTWKTAREPATILYYRQLGCGRDQASRGPCPMVERKAA